MRTPAPPRRQPLSHAYVLPNKEWWHSVRTAWHTTRTRRARNPLQSSQPTTPPPPAPSVKGCRGGNPHRDQDVAKQEDKSSQTKPLYDEGA